MENLTFNPYYEILRQKESQFELAIESGDISPFIFPRDLAPLGILILTLMIRHPTHGVFRHIRYLAFVGLSYLALTNVRKCRMLGVGNGYGLGLFTAWVVIWGATFLVFNDAQRDFKRIERYVVAVLKSETKENTVIQNGSMATGPPQPNGHHVNETPGLRSRTLTERATDLLSDSNQRVGTSGSPSRNIKVIGWQGYPDSIPHRLGWVVDLITNFRGPGWNWRISTLPDLPKWIPRQSDDIYTQSTGESRSSVNDVRSRLWSALVSFLIAYLGLDLAKVLMSRDPYFLGDLSALPPQPYGQYIASSPTLIRTYHLLLSLLGLLSALFYPPSLIALIDLGAFTAFPQIQTRILIPLEATWMYPKAFGRFSQDVLDYGLVGWWGRWWHQFFRFGISEPNRWLFAHLPASLQCKKTKRAVGFLIGFSLSGALHAGGSYTQFGSTNPVSGPFMFFVLQAPAILLHQFLAESVVPLILQSAPPCWLRRLANGLFVLCWFLLVGPIITDDFAAGGIWLLEPVPISPLRALGLGGPGDSWWCWNGAWFRWWTGERWWDSGIQIL